jgi:hypothetical protein
MDEGVDAVAAGVGGEGGEGAGEDGADGAAVGEVGEDDGRGAATGADGVEGAGARLGVALDEDEVSAGLGEREGDRGADACGGLRVAGCELWGGRELWGWLRVRGWRSGQMGSAIMGACGATARTSGRARDEGDLIGEAEEVEYGEAGRWLGGGGHLLRSGSFGGQVRD